VSECTLLGVVISSSFLSMSVRSCRIVDYMLAASNQRLYLLNKLKHAGLDEKGSADVLQAVSCMPLVVLRAWYTSTVTVGHSLPHYFADAPAAP